MQGWHWLKYSKQDVRQVFSMILGKFLHKKLKLVISIRRIYNFSSLRYQQEALLSNTHVKYSSLGKDKDCGEQLEPV